MVNECTLYEQIRFYSSLPRDDMLYYIINDPCICKCNHIVKYRQTAFLFTVHYVR